MSLEIGLEKGKEELEEKTSLPLLPSKWHQDQDSLGLAL